MNNHGPMEVMCLPGWGVPHHCYQEAFSKIGPIEIFDYGFFSPGLPVDFTEVFRQLAEREFSGILIGHSLGSMLAIQAVSEGIDCQALVLFSPFARFSSADGYPGQSLKVIKSMHRQLERNPDSLLRSFYRTMTTPEKFSIDLPDELNIEALQQGLSLLAEFDCRSVLGSINIPVLLIQGEADQVSSPELAISLQNQITSSELILFPGAGHAVPFTKSKAGLEAVKLFIKAKL